MPISNVMQALDMCGTLLVAQVASLERMTKIIDMDRKRTPVYLSDEEVRTLKQGREAIFKVVAVMAQTPTGEDPNKTKEHVRKVLLLLYGFRDKSRQFERTEDLIKELCDICATIRTIVDTDIIDPRALDIHSVTYAAMFCQFMNVQLDPDVKRILEASGPKEQAGGQ